LGRHFCKLGLGFEESGGSCEFICSFVLAVVLDIGDWWGSGKKGRCLCTGGRFGGERVVGLMEGGQVEGLVLFLCWIRVDGEEALSLREVEEDVDSTRKIAKVKPWYCSPGASVEGPSSDDQEEGGGRFEGLSIVHDECGEAETEVERWEMGEGKMDECGGGWRWVGRDLMGDKL